MIEQRIARLNIWHLISLQLEKEGIDPKYKGYKYLKGAVHLVVSDMAKIEAVTKEIYHQLAEDFLTSPEAVERNIRYALSNSPGPMGRSEKRTNKKFITDITLNVMDEIDAFVHQKC